MLLPKNNGKFRVLWATVIIIRFTSNTKGELLHALMDLIYGIFQPLNRTADSKD